VVTPTKLFPGAHVDNPSGEICPIVREETTIPKKDPNGVALSMGKIQKLSLSL
jgi:hypothetical protein